MSTNRREETCWKPDFKMDKRAFALLTTIIVCTTMHATEVLSLNDSVATSESATPSEYSLTGSSTENYDVSTTITPSENSTYSSTTELPESTIYSSTTELPESTIYSSTTELPESSIYSSTTELPESTIYSSTIELPESTTYISTTTYQDSFSYSSITTSPTNHFTSTPSTSATPQNVKSNISVPFSIKFNSNDFNKSLLNSSSPYYQAVASNVIRELTSVFNQSSTSCLLEIRILRFWNGSIGVDYVVVYDSDGLNLTVLVSELEQLKDKLRSLPGVDQGYIDAVFPREIFLVMLTLENDPCVLWTCPDKHVCSKTDGQPECSNPCDGFPCGDGECKLGVDEKPVCICPNNGRFVYGGEHCETKGESLALDSQYIIAIAAGAGGGIVLILLIALIVTCCRQKNGAKKKDDTDQKSEASFRSLNATNGMALMPDGTVPRDDVSNSRLYRDTKPREEIMRQSNSASKMETPFAEDVRNGDDGRLYRVMKERDLHAPAPAEPSYYNKAFDSTGHPDLRDTRKEMSGNRTEPSLRKSSLYSVVDEEGSQYHIYQPPEVSPPRFTPDTPTPLSHYSFDRDLSTRRADDLQRGYEDRQRSDASRLYSDVLKPSFSSTPRSEPGLVYAPVQARLDRPSYRDNPRSEQDRFQREQIGEQNPAYPLDIYTHAVKRNSDAPAVLDYSNPTSKNFGPQPSRYMSNQGSRPITPPLAYTNERYVPSESSAAQRSQIYDYERGPIQRKPRIGY